MISSQANHESEASWWPHTAEQTPSPYAAWRQNLSSRYRFRDSDPLVHDSVAANVAAAYNQAGGDYVAYADGDPTHLFAYNGLHAYADRRVWTLLEAKLIDLRAAGASSIRILDAGCGPGTWLRRLVTRAHVLGFTTITARGFDVARAQIQRARLLARDLCGISGVNLTFDVADLIGELPEADASVDLTLCLYSVRDRCEIEFCDGRHIVLSFHLFAASELRSYFTDHFDIEDLRGLDLFHNRFAPDSRWNPLSLAVDNQLYDELERLEETYATSSGFVERATHLLLVARRRPAAAKSESAPNFGRDTHFSRLE
jgi:SAM-dependent methyltransferase